MEKLLHATPIVSRGAAGVSSDGHPAVEVVDLMPQRALLSSTGTSYITGSTPGSHPIPQVTGITP